MTAQPGKDPTAAPLALPFPQAGPLIEHAYWELALAANGSEEQKRALGDFRKLARPWDPPSCTHPNVRLELWMWLEDVVTWINHEYIWDTAGYIPSCWPEHPHLVHDLAVLADQRRRAGQAITSDSLEDWHRNCLPNFLERLSKRLKTHCDNGHQPSPSTSRHVRHSSDPHHRRRTKQFDTDAALVRASQQKARDSTSLRLVDGELVDPATGEIHDQDD